MKPLSFPLDLDTEVRAVAQYLAQKWTPVTDLEGMVRTIKDAACHDARAWVGSSFSTPLIALRRQRAAQLVPGADDATARTVAQFDAVYGFLFDLLAPLLDYGRTALALDGPWDYSRRVARLRTALSTVHPDLAETRPHGWDQMAANYTEFQGQEEYDVSKDAALFEGSRVESAGSSHLVERTALPYVMYGEKCQSQKASHALVGAIYTQFLGIQEFLNTERLVRDLTEWVAAQPSGMVFELPALPDNPHLRLLATDIRKPRGEAAYLEYQERLARFEALSPEDKAQQEQVSRERVQELAQRLVAEIKAEDKHPNYAQAKAEKAQRLRSRMLDELGS